MLVSVLSFVLNKNLVVVALKPRGRILAGPKVPFSSCCLISSFIASFQCSLSSEFSASSKFLGSKGHTSAPITTLLTVLCSFGGRLFPHWVSKNLLLLPNFDLMFDGHPKNESSSSSSSSSLSSEVQVKSGKSESEWLVCSGS